MIRVNRLDCPEMLKTGINPEQEGEIETKDAITFFCDVVNHEETFKKTGKRGRRTIESFTAYTDKEVRKLLIKNFNKKCAYCESRITTIYSGDIEHFRPKGGYGSTNPITKPGYYWLAADWHNLLFACPFCNQTNTHEITEGGIIREIVQGKLNQFPLLTELYRLNYMHGQIFFTDPDAYSQAFNLEEAERLLLNPCEDNVEKYFKYEELGLILPMDNLIGIEKERAIISINVYALQRMGLVQAREEKIIRIKAQMQRVEEAITNLDIYIDNSDEEKTWFEGILRKEMKILAQYKEQDQEYAGLARYLIDKSFT